MLLCKNIGTANESKCTGPHYCVNHTCLNYQLIDLEVVILDLILNSNSKYSSYCFIVYGHVCFCLGLRVDINFNTKGFSLQSICNQ